MAEGRILVVACMTATDSHTRDQVRHCDKVAFLIVFSYID